MTSTPTSSRPAKVEAEIDRFGLTERLVHWAVALPFLLTMVTGLGLYFPELAKLAGNRELVRDLHRFTGLATILLPALVLVFGDRRRVSQDLKEVDLWSADDRRWFRSWLWRKVGGRDRLPPQGRFNAGQKFNAVLPLLLPSEVEVAHKTGGIHGVRNDVGIVYAPAESGGPYAVAVMSRRKSNQNTDI